MEQIPQQQQQQQQCAIEANKTDHKPDLTHTHSQNSNNSPSNSFLQMTLFVLTTMARGDAYCAENRILTASTCTRTLTSILLFFIVCFFSGKMARFRNERLSHSKEVQRTFYVSGSSARDESTNTHINRQNKAQNCASF